MEFSNSSTKLGIIEQITFLTNASTTEFPLAERTREINEAYSIVADIILRSDGRMQWDDPNHTDQPTGTFNLVDGTATYEIFAALPDAAKDWLTVKSVEVKDSNGNWTKLRPFNLQTDTNIAKEEYLETDSIPCKFDFDGKDIVLYPAPNYASTNGLKIYFDRSPEYFAASDTTKVPGFATIFHHFLSYWAAYKYAVARGKQNMGTLRQECEVMKRDIAQFYGSRDEYEKKVVRSNFSKQSFE